MQEVATALYEGGINPLLVCPRSLFSQPMWKNLCGLCDTDNMIHAAERGFSPSISIAEPSSPFA